MIPIVDLVRQCGAIKEDIDAAVRRVISSGQFILGREVQEFETALARYCETKHAVGVASGTDALALSLKAIGVSHGDIVVTVPFTFIATASAIFHVGATPAFVDIEPDTFNMSASALAKLLRDNSKIRKKTKAIIPVHLYGQMCDMDEIMKISDRWKIPVVEDCAQAIGARYRNKKSGTFGISGCFSFFPTKNLSCFGDGGAIITNVEKLAEKLRMMRAHGSKVRYFYDIIGYNSRLDALHAAILKVKLAHLDKWIQARCRNAKYYDQRLSGYVKTPAVAEHRTHTYHQYTILVKNKRIRDGLMEHLRANGVSVEVYYPLPLHLQRALKHLNYKRGEFPISEQVSQRCLSLPVFAELTAQESKYIADTVISYISAHDAQH